MNTICSKFLVLMFVLPVFAMGAEEDRLSYPELEVTPRATERVQMEARKEARGRWFVHLPIQASSVLTLLAANMAEKKDYVQGSDAEDFDDRVENANYVGGAWLFTSALLAMTYKPYKSGFRELREIKVDSKRDELTRERIAEEILYRPARIAQAMKWLSAVSQFYISVSLMDNATKDSQAIAGIAALGALSPLFFEHPWIANAENHKLYKKKIYGPIAGPTLLQESDGKFAMGYGLQYSF